ncbi:hypothetical protein PAXINDRAFT_99377 [Paxillus involutus ATCC 200175]|uniref:Uncharacterized protein n=1 Tax=Paxillus involutus ATCC 200175 TaxID=664439 RepID=A0A0C9SZD0_PAXIN|nr:hypothetical protein PAXINDRAFT_99377 [Paxillus involutus ATCC 200175]
MSEGSLRICNLTLSTLAFHNLPHTNTIMTGMDAWLIAQCMARLPTLTYFSHPESSLEDFFSAEQTTILNGDSTSGQCGIAEHELRFLSSLRLSLGGSSPSIPNAHVIQTQLDFDCDHARTLCPVDSSSLGNYDSNAIADEHISHQALCYDHDHRSFVAFPRSDTQLGALGLAGVSLLPSLSALHIQGAPTMPISILHTESRRKVSDGPLSSLQGQGIKTVSNKIPLSNYRCCWKVDDHQLCGAWIEGGSKEVWMHVRKAHGLKGRYSGSCHSPGYQVALLELRHRASTIRLCSEAH